MVEIPQLGGIHGTRPGINRIYTLLTFGQNSCHLLLWKDQIITFIDMSQIISIVCFICKWWRWYLSLCWLNIVLSKLFFQMLFRHGSRVQMFAELNKTTSGLQTTKRSSVKTCKSNDEWFCFVVSNWVKETGSIFPCRTITQRNIEYEYQILLGLQLGERNVLNLFLPHYITIKEILNVNIKEHYLVSNWVKERRSIFPCRAITSRSPRKTDNGHFSTLSN